MFQFSPATQALLDAAAQAGGDDTAAHQADAANAAALEQATSAKQASAEAVLSQDANFSAALDAAVTAVRNDLASLAFVATRATDGAGAGPTPGFAPMAATQRFMPHCDQQSPARASDLVAAKYSVQVLHRCRAVSEAHGINYAVLVEAVLKYGPGILTVVQKYGLPLLADLGHLSFSDLVAKYGQGVLDDLTGGRLAA